MLTSITEGCLRSSIFKKVIKIFRYTDKADSFNSNLALFGYWTALTLR
jgi:hypothetical protein